MEMSEEIVNAWDRTMSGRELDVEGFVNCLLAIVARTGVVTGRVTSETEVEFGAGNDLTVVSTDAASSKFRMACARLAVVFGGANREPPVLYGGSLAKRVNLRHGGSLDAELEFANAQDGWFTVRRES